MAGYVKKAFLTEEEAFFGARVYKGIKRLTESHELMRCPNSSYSIILFKNNNKGFLNFLNEQKRDTDVVHPVQEEGVYFVECQKTDEDGMEKFIRRVNKKSMGVTYSIGLEVKKEKNMSTVIFTLIKEYFLFIRSSDSLKVRGYTTNKI